MARKRGEPKENPEGGKALPKAVRETQQSIQSELYVGKPRKHDKKAMKLVNHFAAPGTPKVATADIMQGAPIFYHPDYEPSSLMLPKDRIEINSWCNYFYKYDALVATAIDTHAELPLSKIKLDVPKTQNKQLANQVLDHYVNMIGNTGIDLFNKLLMVGIEYNKLGNVFPWAQMNNDGTEWTRLSCLDPDYINLERLNITDTIEVSLQPNDRLKMIVNNGADNEKTGRIYQSLPDDVIEAVKMGKAIPLQTDPNTGSHVAHIARRLADYHTWGTSLIERNFKTLVYKDRLRQSQDAIAARHLTPKHLIWAENASHADVGEIREQVEDAMMNPDSSIITNYELHWDLVGTSSGLMQLQSEYEWISEDLFIGLMINKSFLLGEGPYAGGQTVLEVLAQKYAIFREQLETYIEKNLFAPIARNCGFVEYVPGTLKKGKVERLIYPKVRWNKLNLVDDTQHKQMMAQLVAEGKLDITTFYEYFGLNSDAIAARIKHNEDTVLDPSYMELRRTLMNEVGRTLGPEVAKQYADAYGIELPEQDPMGGGMMPMASDKRIMKFGSEMEVDYNDEGGFTVKPKLQPSPLSEHVSETREERRKDRDDARSHKRLEDNKQKLQVAPTEQRVLPPRKDLQKRKLVKLSDAAEAVKGKRPEPVEIDPDLPKSEVHDTIDLKGASAADASTQGYADESMLHDPARLAEVQEEARVLSESKRVATQEYMGLKLDQNARRLAFLAEDTIVDEFKKLSNRSQSQTIKPEISRFIPQLYGAILYSVSNKTEPYQQVATQARNAYDREIKTTAAKTAHKLDTLAAQLRNDTQSDTPENIRAKYRNSESQVRGIMRTAVKSIHEQLDSSLS